MILDRGSSELRTDDASPQQAKALLNVLATNVQQYESAFGEIRLEPQGENRVIQ